MSIWLDILCLILLILLNGFFAMSEISIVTARRSKLQMLADQGASGAELALSLSENPTRALSTIQVGITSIGILSGIVGESALVDPLSNFLVDTIHIPAATARGASMAVVVILITYFSIVIGELVPKRIGQMGRGYDFPYGCQTDSLAGYFGYAFRETAFFLYRDADQSARH